MYNLYGVLLLLLRRTGARRDAAFLVDTLFEWRVASVLDRTVEHGGVAVVPRPVRQTRGFCR